MRQDKENLPGGREDNNPSANAGDGHQFNLWSGKITRATEQPGPHATTSEPAHHNYLKPVCSRAQEPQLLSLCATATEAHAPRSYALQWQATAMRCSHITTKSRPRLPQVEKAR